MAPQFSEAIAAALARGRTVVTANERAARAIRRAFNGVQQAAGRTLWTPANILPLESWLAAQWHQRLLTATETRILLNHTQEQALWREILQADPETPRLRSADSLANLAARAWSLLNLYDARTRLREFPPSTDSKAFDRWSRAFDRRLQRARFITASELPAALAIDPQPAALTLVDFDQLSPAADRLITLLEAEHLQTGDSAAEIYDCTAEDDASELLAAARWARERLDRNPRQTIAIVVPNLAERRAAIDRAFGPILAPESLPITSRETPPVYEFSLGRPLAELPLSTAALDLLAWLLKPLPIERIGALLLSSALNPHENPAVAAFDASELRQLSLLRPELTLDRTVTLLQNSSRREALQPVIANLSNLQRAARATQFLASRSPLRVPFAAWADTIRTLLEASGWDRRTNRNSLLFQQHRRFDSALDELATLDALPADGPEDRRCTAAEALAAFTRILRQTIFAPETSNAPVQILGPLEVGGVPFDALWFLSADDLAWPSPATASPLIPWQLQRIAAMPGADRTRDHALAQTLTARIAHSAAVSVFSYALRSDEGDRRPSPLIAPLRPTPLPLAAPPPPHPHRAFNQVPDDATLPPLPATVTRGGSRTLQLQAACAFRAFAETRLHSTPLETRTIGLNPKERGSMVHKVMESFWAALGSQDALRALSEAELASVLTQAIATAIENLKSRPETPWDEAYLGVQQRRLHALLTPWFKAELGRTSFHVLPPEERQHFQLGPLTLALQIDRIDVTEAGHLILDYKTGDADPASWRGERPDEPQLPLYAVLAEQLERSIAGVAFALLRPGNGMGLKGYSDDATLLPNAATMDAPSLADQIAAWRITLTTLAQAYAAGDTRVDPKLYPKTCERCHQRILCRLNPTALSRALASASDSEPLIAHS